MARLGGFTLIELLVTLAIMGMLAALVVPVAEVAVQRAREAELRHNLREIRDAIDAYKHAWDTGHIARKVQASGYPPSLESLVSGVVDARDPKGGKLFFLRRIPRDPMNGDPNADAASTWNKRSYASEPDSPEEGDDVYDVMSGMTGIGLDDRPYREY